MVPVLLQTSFVFFKMIPEQMIAAIPTKYALHATQPALSKNAPAIKAMIGSTRERQFPVAHQRQRRQPGGLRGMERARGYRIDDAWSVALNGWPAAEQPPHDNPAQELLVAGNC